MNTKKGSTEFWIVIGIIAVLAVAWYALRVTELLTEGLLNSSGQATSTALSDLSRAAAVSPTPAKQQGTAVRKSSSISDSDSDSSASADGTDANDEVSSSTGASAPVVNQPPQQVGSTTARCDAGYVVQQSCTNIHIASTCVFKCIPVVTTPSGSTTAR